MPSPPNPAKAAFDQAVELADPADRAACLDQACAGDAALRARVVALLGAYAEAGSFLDTPAAVAGPLAETALYSGADQAGAVLAGRYQLLERVGEGGMGTVWAARQSEPVRRRVAVKLVKAGMDSKQVLARFEAERQALALMDHPNIAKVLDGGLTPDGRPFFVMELVPGVPITTYCDAARLTPRERLALFLPVCQAVQHAHQKGIIHRDLKPSNVLVAVQDDRPVPKVIDFGVAKAAGRPLTDATFETAVGAVVGTPEYMSPEQAGLNHLDVDTRSDVYALGVLLYELLAGSPPFRTAALKAAGVLEMLRVVREDEPPKPSTRLSTADGLPAVAANRHTEPKKLAALVRGELDWIVMKALEKDRARRYETAAGFAADVQRYLSGDAVLAHPPGPGYRLRKALGKNRGLVTAAAVVAAALVAGIVGTTAGLVRAERERAAAEANEGVARAETARALAAVEAARQANRQAVTALRSFTDEVMDRQFAAKRSLTDNEKAIFRNALNQWEVFARAQGDTADADALRAEGAYRVAASQFRLGLDAEAGANYDRAIGLWAKLVGEAPAAEEYRYGLARSRHGRGAVHARRGALTEAEREYEAARALYGRLADDSPGEPKYRFDVAVTFTSLAHLARQLGKTGDAERHSREALRLHEALVAAAPAVADYQSYLAVARVHLADALSGRGDKTGAEAEYRRGVAALGRLAAAFPADPTYRHELAYGRGNLALVLGDLRRGTEAEPEALQAVAIHEKLVADFPVVPDYRQGLAAAHNTLGILYTGHGKLDEAGLQHRRGIAILEKLDADSPGVPEYLVRLGGSYCNLGNLAQERDDLPGSLVWYDKAIRVLAALYERDRRFVQARAFLGNSHLGRAFSCDRLHKHAAGDWDAAVELCRPDMRGPIRVCRAKSRVRAGRLAEATAEVDLLSATGKWVPEMRFDFASVYAIAAATDAGKRDEYAGRAIELLGVAVKHGYADVARLKEDHDLRAVRDRADFKALVADLEKRTPSPVKKP